MGSEGTGPSPEASTAIVALTQQGVRLGLQIHARLPGSVCYVPRRHRFALTMGAVGFDRLGLIVPELWRSYRSLVFVMATGIVVRQIAPFVSDKASDPAVVVLDERGSFVVSLLSGHLGGANRLAGLIARITGGQAVITTATDVQNKPAVDLLAQEAGLEIENREMVGRVTRAILEDEPVWIYDPGGYLREGLKGEGSVFRLETDRDVALQPRGRVGIWVAEHPAPGREGVLYLRPRNLVVGVGCNRGTGVGEILALVHQVFLDHSLTVHSIRNIATVDIKSHEPGIIELGRTLNRPVAVFTRAEIAGIRVPNPSPVVEQHLGVRSVCEATALLSAQVDTLLVPKRKSANATVAVARVASPL